MESLIGQLQAFSVVLLAGVSCGVLFDLFRVLRGLLNPGKINTAILDLLFWALLTPVLILYILLANWGELRAYVFVGLLLGLLFYKLLLSGFVLHALLFSLNLLLSLCNGIIMIVVWLLFLPYRLIQTCRFKFKTNFVPFRANLRWKRKF